MQVTSQRASAILYNYLSGNHFDKPFLLPANVCPVVPLSFMKAGVGFEFIDIDESHVNREMFDSYRGGKIFRSCICACLREKV